MQPALPSWTNKCASEASAAERKTFLDLARGVEDTGTVPAENLLLMQAALEQDPAWARVKDEKVNRV